MIAAAVTATFRSAPISDHAAVRRSVLVAQNQVMSAVSAAATEPAITKPWPCAPPL